MTTACALRCLPLVLLLSLTACAQEKDLDKMLDGLLKHSVREVTPTDVAAMTSPILLDARERAEYEVSHLPGAIWVGYEDFDLSRLPKVDGQRPIVVYCSVGHRSERIAEKSEAAGYKNVSNLRGGVFAWVNEGRSVVDQNGPTERVHAYNAKWAKWLEKGEKTW
jgi:rhodanese-related sulfurtransferase